MNAFDHVCKSYLDDTLVCLICETVVEEEYVDAMEDVVLAADYRQRTERAYGYGDELVAANKRLDTALAHPRVQEFINEEGS